jgi:hypothetical protein
MHATQPQGGACPEPRRDPDESAGYLAGLFTDPDRFRTWVATAANTAAQPITTPDESQTEQVQPDGYVVTDAGVQALAKTSDAETTDAAAEVIPARVLRSAALYMERYGWIQGSYYDATAGVFTPAACLVGAIGMVCYGGPVEAPAQHFDDPGFLDLEQAVLHLDRYLLVHDGSESYEFNDANGRRVEDVLHVLRQAADTGAEELLDAIRAIDATNAQMAVLVDLLTPRGIWGDNPVSASSDGGDTE